MEGATAPLAEFNDVFDPVGDPQNAFIGMVTNYPNFVGKKGFHLYLREYPFHVGVSYC